MNHITGRINLIRRYHNMTEPNISIIIPVYNVEPYIADCLQSVISQKTECKIECIVVDDCGRDRSMDIVSDFVRDYAGPVTFRIIRRTRNGGLSAARNSGIRVASGKYLYFLDSDDLITPDAIDLLWARAREYPDAQIVCGNFQTFPEKDIMKTISLTDKNFPKYSDDINWIRSVFLSTFPVIACNKLISRKFIVENGLYFREGILHEDNHWQALAYPYVKALAFVDEQTYLYRIRPGSITQSDNGNLRRLKNLALIYEEMFARGPVWDYDWTRWVFNCLNELKFPQYFDYDEAEAGRIYAGLSGILVSNRAIPRIVRLLFRYHRLPRRFMRGKIIYFILRHYYGRVKSAPFNNYSDI